MKLTKYSDIPKFPFSSYSVDVSLDYVLFNLSSFMEQGEVELNPEFQRGHVWSPEQQTAYMEFRMRGGMSGKDIYFNHPSWQGGYKKGDKLVCVDGLQRLSAAVAFLFGQIPVFGSYIYEYEERLRMAGQLNFFTFHIANLKTDKEIMEWYLSLNEGGTPHSESEINRVKEMVESA